MESPTVKSFKLRGTRITAAQLDARERLWTTYGVDYVDHGIDLEGLFPGREKIVAEIGFGMGEATITLDFFQDFALAKVDATLWPLIGTTFPVTVKPTSAA